MSDDGSDAWRAGPPRKSRLGVRLFTLGGSNGWAAVHLLIVACAIGGSAWLARAGQPMFRWLPLPLAFVSLSAARRQLRGLVAVWTGALELRSSGRSRFEPWGNARAWRRSSEFGEFDLIVRFAQAADADAAGVTISCTTHSQREAIVECLLTADVPHEPWLDDPRKVR
ncbi:MAG: hypothetical protein EXS13_05495 [Planctomycetes bacterium]|nr:hypothetical protein [Planctomycetota bacterium]